MSDSQSLATYSVTNTSGEQTVTLQVNNNLKWGGSEIIFETYLKNHKNNELVAYYVFPLHTYIPVHYKYTIKRHLHYKLPLKWKFYQKT